MTTYRYPVQVWRDEAGNFTAAPVEDLGYDFQLDEPLAAMGSSAGVAIDQLRTFLERRARDEGWLPPSSVSALRREELVVHARPTFKERNRRFPGDRTVRLVVECWLGDLGGGLRIASNPRLGLRLVCYAGDPVHDLVKQHLLRQWQEYGPADLSRLTLPPLSVLDEVVVRAPALSAWTREPDASQATLEAVAYPLDDRTASRRFGPAYEREAVIDALTEHLAEGRSSLLIVGAPGSGKSTVLAAAVRRLARGASPKAPKRFWVTSGARLIAGMAYLGQWEERCVDVVAELRRVDGVLCLESLIDAVTIGGSEPGEGVAAFLAGFVETGELRLVAEASPADVEACRRLLPRFVDLFRVVRLEELDRRASLSILDRIAEQRAAAGRRIDVGRGLTDQIYQMHRRFASDGAFPGAAARFTLELFDRAARDGLSELTRDDAIRLFIERTGLPEVFVRDELPLRYETIFDALRADVLGQDEACRTVAEVICAFKVGLEDPTQPIATLLFAGPTGVGKTQLAKTLSTFLFGHGEDADRLLRLDMSEYALGGASARLLGSARAGGSGLIERVRRQPFTVVLLDEIEKASPDLFDILLGLLDEGRLTDATGRTTSFRSTIVIMTSNVGASSAAAVGFGEAPPPDYAAALEATFRPELINRIDEIVTFEPLDRATVLDIAGKELSELAEREGLARDEVRLTWSATVVEHVVERGFDPRYGARNLQRAIEAQVVVPLARWLAARPGPRPRTLAVDVEDGAVTVSEAG